MVFGFFRPSVKKDISSLIRGFREKGYRLFGGMEHAPETLEWGSWIKRASRKKGMEIGDGFMFSRLSLLLAMHDFNFPLGAGRSVDHAFTDGRGDCGIDGIALAVGNTTLYTCDDVCRVIEEDPTAPVRILFHKSKLPEDGSPVQLDEDIVAFCHDILFWLGEPEQIVLDRRKGGKANINEAANAQWGTYNCLRKCFAGLEREFSPEIVVIFSADGHWEDEAGSRATMQRVADQVGTVLPKAVVRADIWGKGQLEAAANYARIAVNRMIHNYSSIRMPTVELPDVWNSVATRNEPVRVQGFAGHIPARDLLRVFMKTAAEGDNVVPGLDYSFFRDSPRHYLAREGATAEGGTGDSWNIGAHELEKSLVAGEEDRALPGQPSLVGYGHNGVIIVARKALLRPGTQEAQVSKVDSMELVAPQVVNGAQTCFVMHQHWDALPGVFVPLRIIVSASYNVKDYIIAASNTQHPMGDWDMFTRWPEVRTFQRKFRQGFSSPETEVWLQRRRNKPFEEVVEIERTVLARDLLEAAASCFYGLPHVAQGDPKQLLKRHGDGIRFGKDIFCANHITGAYRAVAWLLVASKKFRKALDKDAPYLPRNFHVYALWRLVDRTPDSVNLLDMSGYARFQAVIDAIVRDGHENGGALARQAADIVWAEMAAGHEDETLTSAIRARTP